MATTAKPGQEFFTADYVAAYLGVSRQTVYAMLARGCFPSYKIGDTPSAPRRIRLRDVDKWLAEHREECAA
jgi:excisionase family DNA binding protein